MATATTAANGAAAAAQSGTAVGNAALGQSDMLISAKVDPLSVSGNALMYVTGGAAVVALGYNMLFNKPETVDPAKCPNHKCHDDSYRYHIPTPEEEIVAKYLG